MSERPEQSDAYLADPTPERISDGDSAYTSEKSADGDKRHRNEQVLVRLTPDELADARRLAAANGLTVPALFRAGLTLISIGEAP